MTVKEASLKRQIKDLRRQKNLFYHEMVERGEEISCMIRIFLTVRDILPEGPRERLEKLAKRYAERNDKDRGSVYCKGMIDFRDEGKHFSRDNSYID